MAASLINIQAAVALTRGVIRLLRKMSSPRGRVAAMLKLISVGAGLGGGLGPANAVALATPTKPKIRGAVWVAS